MKQPQFFILGAARSGTTLIRMILNAHPEIGIPPEGSYITRFYRKGYENKILTKEKAILLVDILFRFSTVFKTIGLDETKFINELKKTPILFADLIEHIFSQLIIMNGKKIAGSKAQEDICRYKILVKLFPEAKYIVPIRDGRDVALSLDKVAFKANRGVSRIEDVAYYWKRRIKNGNKMKKSLGKNYYSFKYEELIESPEVAVKSICDFLNVKFHNEMLNFYQDFSKNPQLYLLPDEIRDGHHENLKRSIISHNAYKWKKEMSEKDRYIFESIARKQLLENGYELSIKRKNLYYDFLVLLAALRHFFIGPCKGLLRSINMWADRRKVDLIFFLKIKFFKNKIPKGF